MKNKTNLNMPGFKLPRMTPFYEKHHEDAKAKVPKQAKPAGEQKNYFDDAKEQFKKLASEKIKEQGKIIAKEPPKPGQSNAVLKQTVSSSGGSDLDEFLKRIESRKIKNPEYADVEGPEYSKSYDFFITNRNDESDKVARQMDSLNKAVMDQAKNRQFDEMKKTRAYQKDLMNKYNID